MSQTLDLPANQPPTYTVQQFPETIAVFRLAPGADVPGWAQSS